MDNCTNSDQLIRLEVSENSYKNYRKMLTDNNFYMRKMINQLLQ